MDPFILVSRDGTISAIDGAGTYIRTGHLSFDDMLRRLPGAEVIRIRDEEPQAAHVARANARVREEGARPRPASSALG